MSVSVSNPLEILQSTPCFKNVDDSAMRHLASEAFIARFKDKELIVKRGHHFPYLCVIAGGAIDLTLTNKAGKRHVLGVFNLGQLYGLIPVIDQKPLLYESSALGACTLLMISREHFMQCMAQHPSFMEAILLVFCQRSRDSFSYIASQRLLSPLARLANHLLVVSKKYGNKDAYSPNTNEVNLSQSDLAEMLGVSRQILNRDMSKLENLGLIEKKYSKIVLIDMAGLEALVASEG